MRAVMVLSALAFAIAAVTVTSSAMSLADFKVPDGQVSWDTVRSTLMRGVDDSTPHTFFKGLMENTVAQLPRAVRHRAPSAPKAGRGKGQYRADGTPNFGPWFGWIPLFMDSAVPASAERDAVVGSWSAPCFQNNTLSVALNTDGSGAVLTITSTNPSTLLCSDWYLIGCLDGLVFKTQDSLSPGASDIKYEFKSTISASELADLKANGFRVFRFLDDAATILVDLYDTIMLFLPAMTTTGPVPQTCAEANLQFLDAYVDIQMEARNTTVVSIDEGLVQSGDLFGIIRLDGLDPMLAWAMGGSHTGHTTVAMRSTDGVLHVCESTTKDNYWPTNGIQCTPFQQWITQAINADYNVLWLPLSQQSRGVFNNTKAWDYVNADLNLNYGFGNMLWAWVDTESDNYPWPLTWQAHELLPAWLGHLSETIADLLWAQAFNIRVGQKSLNIPDVYAAARAAGLDFGALSSLAEQDSWLYSQPDNNGTTVYGHSSVCDVFVCRVWKEAGLFGDTDFQCTEATNWDIYTLDIFEQNVALPPQCTAADPELPYCQLVGKYRMRLPQFNTRGIYENSFANCPRGSPPDFNKPIGC